ncbi:hypothetical protein J7T55_010427 [Diaporthe amygdali]|uniref:uncharacterized protein n=1 Tax=Phomopsis amygdali TaxID=1214568 RepID=UPI0022FE1CCE|nr:uncharacterized protein J7T55_010427 [Diaporthe amygdali]KAJ0115604.1 hypothetical protein J7T55_010427 [Diaporthe amygdali]
MYASGSGLYGDQINAGLVDMMDTFFPADQITDNDYSALPVPLASAFRGWDSMERTNESNELQDASCCSVEGNPSLGSFDQMNSSLPGSRSTQDGGPPTAAAAAAAGQDKDERRLLWNVYTSQLVHSITAHQTDIANPLIDYLLPRALESSSFRSAILYLAFVMRSNQSSTNPSQYNTQTSLGQRNLPESSLGAHLENEALSEALPKANPPLSDSHSRGPTDANTSLNTLATLVILCTAYVASGNSRSLLVCLEQAFLLTKMLSNDFCSNEEFVFLVHYLGYIHTIAMLSPGEYRLNAPDFLTIFSKSGINQQGDLLKNDPNATFTPKISLASGDFNADARSQRLEKLAVEKIQREIQSSCFGDITPTTGISNSVASLLYHVGRLSRLKGVILSSQPANENQWFWGAFEADVEGLELRLGQMLRHRDSQSRILETFVQKLKLLSDEHKDSQLQQAIDKTRYNDALVLCVRVILLAKVQNINSRDIRIPALTQRILSLCSLIENESHTAGLLVFPLYTAGLYTHDPDARSFIKQRLKLLSGRIVTDTEKLSQNLETSWQNASDEAAYDQEPLLASSKDIELNEANASCCSDTAHMH